MGTFRRLCMLNSSLFFACATLGCTITFNAGAGPREKQPPQTDDPSTTLAHSVDDPIFVDWSYKTLKNARGGDSHPPSPRTVDPDSLTERVDYNDKNIYVPMPHPGGAHGPGFTGSMNWLVRNSMKKVAESGAPVTFLIRHRNCPFPYDTHGSPTTPNALRDALASLPKLDYLFMDLEGKPSDITRNVREIVRLVRSHPNPQIANAYIGNYNDGPETYNDAMIWAATRNRESVGATSWNQSRFYLESGMNVAMPIAYPYEAYSVHTSVRNQGTAGTTPNDRAAMLWTPIERVSAAARALPEGHKIVPWVSNFISFEDESRRDMYHAAPQSDEDQTALIQHLRLRGADGFALFAPEQTESPRFPQLSYTNYRELAMHAWASLDEIFDNASSFEILTLETTKRSGVVWSGVRSGDHVAVLVSNLSGKGQPVSIPLPSIQGLPESTEPVADGSHKLFVYQLPAGSNDPALNALAPSPNSDNPLLDGSDDSALTNEINSETVSTDTGFSRGSETQPEPAVDQRSITLANARNARIRAAKSKPRNSVRSVSRSGSRKSSAERKRVYRAEDRKESED